MTRKLLLILWCFILLPLVLGDYNYSQVGGTDQDFVLGTGFFNSALASYDSYTRSVDRTGGTMPLVADLDGDGINEIIVLDGATFRLYHGKTLSIVDAYTSPYISGVPAVSVFDIDGDGTQELIIASQKSDIVQVLEYNGTHFFNKSVLSVAWSSGTYSGIKAFNCIEANKCLLVGSPNMRAGSGNGLFRAVFFNSTHRVDGLDLAIAPYTSFCVPNIPVVSVADYDGDGTQEFIFSYGVFGSGVDAVKIGFVSINASDEIVYEQEISRSCLELSDGLSSQTCDSIAAQNVFTAPLVFDLDGSSSNGLESVIGLMVASDEFKMYSYYADGSVMDNYPEVAHADGLILSNVMLFNAFTDTGRVDFCVMGYEAVERELDLCCASEQTGTIPQTKEFFFGLGNFYNLSTAAGNWERLAHATQHSTATIEGNNLDEVINSYGVFSLSYAGLNHLVLEFENPKSNAVVLSVDAEKVDREDLLVLSSTNLWYLDDKFSNTAAEISAYYVDPCIDHTWKENTTVEVRISAVDGEGDDVNVSAILYYGLSFNQTSAWSVAASGSTQVFNFVANETVGTATLRLRASDVRHPTEWDVIDLSVSVATTGISWGDGCVTDVEIGEVTNVSDIPADMTEDEKAEIREAILGGGLIPMNYAPLVSVLAIILLVVASALVLAQQGIRDGAVLLYLPLGVGVVSWLFFVCMGMIAGWTVIVAVLVGSATIGYKVYAGKSVVG